MTTSARPEPAGEGGAWGRGDAALLALAVTTLALLAAQFALAGFGAFTMDKTPSDNTYQAHAVLGLVLAAMTLLMLAVVLASRAARAHRRTFWLAVALAVLTIAVQPALGSAGTKVPVVGALHALNAVAILALTGWLTRETARRKAAGATDRAGAASARARADLR